MLQIGKICNDLFMILIRKKDFCSIMLRNWNIVSKKFEKGHIPNESTDWSINEKMQI